MNSQRSFVVLTPDSSLAGSSDHPVVGEQHTELHRDAGAAVFMSALLTARPVDQCSHSSSAVTPHSHWKPVSKNWVMGMLIAVASRAALALTLLSSTARRSLLKLHSRVLSHRNTACAVPLLLHAAPPLGATHSIPSTRLCYSPVMYIHPS